MFEAHYVFRTDWLIPDSAKTEAADTLEDLDSLALWWPSVYLEVTTVVQGGAHGLGRVADLYTKGWLPYTLRWRMEIVEVDYPHGSPPRPRGALCGRGNGKLHEGGPGRAVAYDWRVEADKPLLRY